jgi:hypothetical protein
MKIKSTRGDLDNWFNHLKLSRDSEYFKGYDINNIFDDRLYQQNIKISSIVKINKVINNDMDDVTVVLTSCNRPELLEKTLISFIKYNTYRNIKETIIIDDSGIYGCNNIVLNKPYLNPYLKILNIKSIYNKTNIGQIQSIDKAYSYVKTKYIFHCEEDWEFLQTGFIEKSLKISFTLMFTPTLALHLNSIPSCSNMSILLSTTVFSNLKSGIPKRKYPPIASSAS